MSDWLGWFAYAEALAEQALADTISAAGWSFGTALFVVVVEAINVRRAWKHEGRSAATKLLVGTFKTLVTAVIALALIFMFGFLFRAPYLLQQAATGRATEAEAAERRAELVQEVSSEALAALLAQRAAQFNAKLRAASIQERRVAHPISPPATARADHLAARSDLAPLLAEAGRISQQCLADHEKPPPMSAVNEWARRVIATFEKHGLDESFRVRFANPNYPYNFGHGAPKAHEQCWNVVNKAKIELSTLIGELR